MVNKYLTYEEAALNAVRHYLEPECWGPDVECPSDVDSEDVCWIYSLGTNKWVPLWSQIGLDVEDRFRLVFYSYVRLSARQAYVDRKLPGFDAIKRRVLEQHPNYSEATLIRWGYRISPQRIERWVGEGRLVESVHDQIRWFQRNVEMEKQLKEAGYKVEFVPYQTEEVKCVYCDSSYVGYYPDIGEWQCNSCYKVDVLFP